jgi:hypothetical protein
VLLWDCRLGEVRRMTSWCYDALDSLSTTLFDIVSTRIDRGVGVVAGGGHGCAVKTKLVGCASPPMPASSLCSATPAAKPQVPPQVYIPYWSPGEARCPGKLPRGGCRLYEDNYRLDDVAPRDIRCRLSGASEWGRGRAQGANVLPGPGCSSPARTHTPFFPSRSKLPLPYSDK